MVKTIRVMLIPNNRQRSKLFQYANIARFAYNWALTKEQTNYKSGGKFLSDVDLRQEFTKMKQTQEYEWLNDVSNNVTKQAINEGCVGFLFFLGGLLICFLVFLLGFPNTERQRLGALLDHETQETVMAMIPQFSETEIGAPVPAPAEVPEELGLLVFNMEDPDNILRAITGEPIGTIVKEDVQ